LPRINARIGDAPPRINASVLLQLADGLEALTRRHGEHDEQPPSQKAIHDRCKHALRPGAKRCCRQSNRGTAEPPRCSTVESNQQISIRIDEDVSRSGRRR
jgi:uncharacterized protein (DUF4415 family)